MQFLYFFLVQNPIKCWFVHLHLNNFANFTGVTSLTFGKKPKWHIYNKQTKTPFLCNTPLSTLFPLQHSYIYIVSFATLLHLHWTFQYKTQLKTKKKIGAVFVYWFFFLSYLIKFESFIWTQWSFPRKIMHNRSMCSPHVKINGTVAWYTVIHQRYWCPETRCISQVAC